MPNEKTAPSPDGPASEGAPAKNHPLLTVLAVALCVFAIGLMLSLSGYALQFDAVYRGF